MPSRSVIPCRPKNRPKSPPPAFASQAMLRPPPPCKRADARAGGGNLADAKSAAARCRWQKKAAAPKLYCLQRWGRRTSTWGITGGTLYHALQDHFVVRRRGAGLHRPHYGADRQGLCPLFGVAGAPRPRLSLLAGYLEQAAHRPWRGGEWRLLLP